VGHAERVTMCPRTWPGQVLCGSSTGRPLLTYTDSAHAPAAGYLCLSDFVSAGSAQTEQCGTFAGTGICPYGHKCQFAHGFDELRSRQASCSPPARRPPFQHGPAADLSPSPRANSSPPDLFTSVGPALLVQDQGVPVI